MVLRSSDRRSSKFSHEFIIYLNNYVNEKKEKTSKMMEAKYIHNKISFFLFTHVSMEKTGSI